MKRILHVLPVLTSGGAERVVSDLIRTQRLEGFQSHLCVLGRPPSAVPGYSLPPVEFLNWPGSLRDFAGIARCVRLLKHVADRLRVDVIHAHLWPAALIAAGCRIPCIVHVHDTMPWLESARLCDMGRRALHRVALGAADARFIAVADAVKSYAAANLYLLDQRIAVVHNGINVDHFQPDSQSRDQTFTIGAVGRLVPEKGFDQLVRAVAQLHQQGLQFRLLIAGDGSQRPALEQIISCNELTDVVQMVGAVHDMQTFYRQLDVFVLPSVEAEGLPMTVLEAMSMALPVVATVVGGTPEAISHGQDGLLVPPGDPAALADALLLLFCKPELRHELGQSARRRVCNHFTCERMAQGVADQYRAMAA